MHHRLPPLPPDVLAAELAYVAGARGVLSRAWRSLRAAWRCSRIAARQRRLGAP